MRFFNSCWKLWGYPWTAREMTENHYKLLIALEEFSKDGFTETQTEAEWIQQYQEKKKKQKQDKAQVEEDDTIREAQQQMIKKIIEEKENK